MILAKRSPKIEKYKIKEEGDRKCEERRRKVGKDEQKEKKEEQKGKEGKRKRRIIKLDPMDIKIRYLVILNTRSLLMVSDKNSNS